MRGAILSALTEITTDHNAMQLNEKRYSDSLSARHTLAPHGATQMSIVLFSKVLLQYNNIILNVSLTV